MCVCVLPAKHSYLYIKIYGSKMYGSKLWIRLRHCREKLKNKVIESEESYMNESRHYNVSVSINHRQDQVLSCVFRFPMDV